MLALFRRNCFLFFLMIGLQAMLEGAETTRVVFAADRPVSLQSQARFEMQQSFPGFSLSTKGEQTIRAACSIQHTQKTPIQAPPFNGMFSLKQIAISLEANDQKIAFDSNSSQDKGPFYLKHLVEILNQPMPFQVVEDGACEINSPQRLSLIDRVAPLQELNIKTFISCLLIESFLLAGEELTKGKEFTRSYTIPAFPKEILYTVSNIDDYHVYVDFAGELEKSAFALTRTMNIGREEVPVTIKLNGSVEGKGRWNRDHALLFEAEMHYTYTAQLSAGPLQWMTHFDMIVENRSASAE